MPKRKSPQRSFGLGWWVDETVPALDDLLVKHGIDGATFAEWLGPPLGFYRGSVSFKEAMPSRSEEIEAISELLGNLQASLRGIAPNAIPPIAMARLMTVALKHETNVFELEESLRSSLYQMIAFLSAVKQEFVQLTPRRGRKPLDGRNQLAAAIVDKLRELAPMSADVARSLASTILIRCKVSTPDDLARPTRRVRVQK